MDYLGREAAPFDADLWQQIDKAVTSAAGECLTGRRFLPFFGPMGPGVNVAEINALDKTESFGNGLATTKGRKLVQIPQIYEDFWLYWRDLEARQTNGPNIDLTAARMAAQKLAFLEDSMIFYGLPTLELEGLLTAKGVRTLSANDWRSGENAFTDIANGIATLLKNGRFGRHTLIVSQDIYAGLHRIQPSVGLLELDRVKNLLEGRLYSSVVLKSTTALLVCAQPQYMDLFVGQDIKTAYTEQVDLNHHLRIMETAVLRIKTPDAIVVFK